MHEPYPCPACDEHMTVVKETAMQIVHRCPACGTKVVEAKKQ